MLGYRVSLSIKEFRELYDKGLISKTVLDKTIESTKGSDQVEHWRDLLLTEAFQPPPLPRIGALRSYWKKSSHIDIDNLVHPLLWVS